MSVSVTFAARTVTLQLSFSAKSVAGSSVKVRGPPDTVAWWAPLVVHEIENQSPLVETSSLNVMLMPASRATSAAFGAGVVAVTRGASSVGTSQECGAVALFRGAVAAVGEIEGVVVGVDAAAVARSRTSCCRASGRRPRPRRSSRSPYPMRSRMRRERGGVEASRADRCSEAARSRHERDLARRAVMLIGAAASGRSGAGSGVPIAPGGLPHEEVAVRLDRAGRVELFVAAEAPVPVALAYCTDKPSTRTGAVPRLNSSMKSFL